MIGIGLGVANLQINAVEQIINATVAPVLGSLTDAQTPADAFTVGTYTSSEGTIASQTVAYFVNGVEQVGTFDLTAGETVQARETVTDSAGNQRVFSTALVTATPSVALSNATAPAISGEPRVGQPPLTLSDGTWNGSAPRTFTYRWEVDGADAGVTVNTFAITSAQEGADVQGFVTADDGFTQVEVGSNVVTITAAIQATTAPVLGALTDAQTPVDAFTAGTYTAGPGLTIVSQVVTYTVDGVEQAGTFDLTDGEDVQATETVTDSGGNVDTFTTALVTVTTPPVTDVILMAGQSNMIGRATFDGGDTHPAGTLQYTVEGGEVAATIPLDHPDANAGQMGLDIEFARSYLAANPQNTLVFVPVAFGGTGFQDNSWNKGNVRYNNAVTQANAAIGNYPGARFSILWHQGETDSLTQADADLYLGRFRQFISDIRGDITGAAICPFVAGEIGEQFADPGTSPGAPTINVAINQLESETFYYNVVETGDLTGIDIFHFDAASLRTMGQRYYAQWVAALTDVAAPVISGVPTISGDVRVERTVFAVAAPTDKSPTTTTWQWNLDGAPISGATSNSYTIPLASQGGTLSVTQTSTTAAGSDTATSAGSVILEAAASAIQNAVETSTASALWLPTDSFDDMYQDTTGPTTPVTSNSDLIGWIEPRFGTLSAYSAFGFQMLPDVGASNLLNFTTDPTSELRIQPPTPGANMYFACVTNNQPRAGTLYMLAPVGTNDTYAGGVRSNGSLPADVQAGTIVYKIDGVVIPAPVTQGDLYAAIHDSTPHVFEMIGVDMSAGEWLSQSYIRMLFNFGFFMGDVILCDTPSAADQDQIRQDLADRHSITVV